MLKVRNYLCPFEAVLSGKIQGPDLPKNYIGIGQGSMLKRIKEENGI
ncbi:MAG: hypothetical protein AB1422_14215 [bacterium]